MSKFTGFSDWVEIFKGGKQVDSQGREHDGDELIDKAVSRFNAAEHEPPAVIGHPVDNAPAFGWVKGLQSTISNGVKILQAKFDQVVPEFEDMVKQGLFKKRSAAFYPDGRLRHVGFLGAMPPAVKGLADLKFESSDNAVSFDFYDPGMGTIAGILRNLRDYFIEKEGQEKADKIIPDWEVEYVRDNANKETQTDKQEAVMATGFKDKVKGILSFMGVDISKVPDEALPADDGALRQAQGAQSAQGTTGDKMFSEADLDQVRKAAEAEGRKKAEVEFAEKGIKARKDARIKEISAWCDGMVFAGKIAPAWIKFGLPQIMEFLASSEDVVEFGEGDGKAKATPYDRLKTLFEEEMPRLIDFKEIAKRDGDPGTGSAGEKLTKLTRDKMAKDKTLDYIAAFAEVQRENPDLTAEYAAEMKG